MEKFDNVSDEQLVSFVLKDQENYREVVKRYEHKLYRYIVYLIKDKDKSKDVLQNTFLKAFINLRGFNQKRKFSSWIYRIAHNEAINEIKKHRKEILSTKKDLVERRVTSKENIYKDITDKETQTIVRKHLEKLPLKYKEPLILYYLEEKTYREISDILRISVGGVGTRINRAKNLMKQIYEKKEKQQ